MQKKVFYIFLFMFVLAIFSCLMPYPIFSNYTNINEQNINLINAYYESETTNITCQQTKLLDVEFAEIDCLMPIGLTFELIDPKTQHSALVTRVGGKHHFDIEFLDSNSSSDIFLPSDKSDHNFLSLNTKPVLIKFNDYCFFPASLSPYQHGYSTKNNLGHFCLHFKNSKLDYSAKHSPMHQNTVEKAQDLCKKYLRTYD